MAKRKRKSDSTTRVVLIEIGLPMTMEKLLEVVETFRSWVFQELLALQEDCDCEHCPNPCTPEKRATQFRHRVYREEEQQN